MKILRFEPNQVTLIRITFAHRKKLNLLDTNTLYAVSPERAGYVSFCLDHRHRNRDYYDRFCSTDRPHGLRILKRIAERRPDGSLIVRGDSPRALDSQLLGPVKPEQIRAWWRPLIQI